MFQSHRYTFLNTRSGVDPSTFLSSCLQVFRSSASGLDSRVQDDDSASLTPPDSLDTHLVLVFGARELKQTTRSIQENSEVFEGEGKNGEDDTCRSDSRKYQSAGRKKTGLSENMSDQSSRAEH